MTSILTLPILGGLYIPLVGYFTTAYDPDQGCQDSHIWNLDSCLRSYTSCIEWGSSSYSCSSQFRDCIGYWSGYGYDFDCEAMELYSVSQMFLVLVAMLTDLLLVILTAKHHCCGATQPGTVYAAGNSIAPPGSVVYVVPQGYTMPHNTGVVGYPTQGQHQLVSGPQPQHVIMPVAGGQHQASGIQPPEYTENKNLM